MKVFIAGGTGFVGSVVSQKIKSSGASVTLLERNKNKISTLKEQGYEVFEGTLEDEEAVNVFLSANKFDAVQIIAVSHSGCNEYHVSGGKFLNAVNFI